MKKVFNNPFASLKFRNFRIYWVGMNISLIGLWMQNIAQPWLALILTNDPSLVALVAVVQFLPPLFLTLISGALVDKLDTKKMLLASQSGLMLVALGFTIMLLFFEASYTAILVLAFLNGVFNSFDAPTRQSIVYELVDDDKFMPNAIAINSMSFNVARMIGPAVAGIVIANLGIMYCFLFNAISYAAIIISLLFVRDRRVVKKAGYLNLFASLKSGLIYIKESGVLKLCLTILLIMTLFLPHYNVTISAFAKFSLEGDEKTFGYLMSFLGVGSFLGALFIASVGKLNLKQILITPFLCAFSLMMIGIFPNFYLAGLFLAMTGFFFVITSASLNSTIQLNTKNEFRGRVMSMYAFIFQGSIPFGAMYSGVLVNKFSPNLGLIICAMSAIVFMSILILFYKTKEIV
ncbi:MAG: MFS transporter [Campylobacteraceae bacterium]|nr:MFS transporter [Campylobacteraceae bacterium]